MRFQMFIAVVMLHVAVAAKTEASPAQDGPFNKSQQMEIAVLDAATMLGKSASWIRSETEAAIELFQQRDQLVKFVSEKIGQYDGNQSGEKYFDQRMSVRVSQLKGSLKNWNQFVPQYLKKQPEQIATELKRQRQAVERFKKSKRPRASSIAYIPKNVWETKDRLRVLSAAGFDTSKLQAEQEQVEEMVLEVIESLDVADIAKANSTPRDAYRRDDRQQIETFVRSQWTSSNDKPIVRIVMPRQSWSNTYGLKFDADNKPHLHEVDRMTVYVATRKTDEVLTLNPFRIERMNFKVHGKLLGKPDPQTPRQIETSEFPFDVLEKKIR